MGERVPIFPKNECYQYPAHSQKRQIHCWLQGAQPLGGVWGGAPRKNNTRKKQKNFNLVRS